MPPHKTVVLNVVALTRGLISAADTPFLHSLLEEEKAAFATVEPAFPALTCTGQLAYTTGKGAEGHGIVGNGFYDRQYCEVRNWHQSSQLVECPRLWHRLKAEHPGSTVFVNGWWHGMHDPGLDFFINVRPQYMHDGGKKADVYTYPPELRHELQGKLGTFPLHKFWGPTTGIEASRWIAESSMMVDRQHNPTLTFMYLPHMDYSLQKYGPGDKEQVPADLREIDALVQRLVEYYEGEGRARVVILSEYGIAPVDRVVYLNRELRHHGWLRVRTECGGETLDCGESPAFAVCDHQVAHIYVRKAEDISAVKAFVAAIPGVDSVYEGGELNKMYEKLGHGKGAGRGAHHAGRGGDLVAVTDARSWFAYYYWLSDDKAPDFARCVAIHKKPGYDPAEMLFRYASPWGFIYLLWKVFKVYALRIRDIVDATPLECSSIRGSHGRMPEGAEYKPIIISRRAEILPRSGGTGCGMELAAEDVCELIYRHLVD